MSERSSQEGTENGTDYWGDPPRWKGDFSDCDLLSHKSLQVGYISGKAVSGSEGFTRVSDVVECTDCQNQVDVDDRRWFGTIITGTRRWGSDETGWTEAPIIRNAWAWKLVCPCCEREVVIAETTDEDPRPETIKQAYADGDGVMSEESLEESLTRVMDA